MGLYQIETTGGVYEIETQDISTSTNLFPQTGSEPSGKITQDLPQVPDTEPRRFRPGFPEFRKPLLPVTGIMGKVLTEEDKNFWKEFPKTSGTGMGLTELVEGLTSAENIALIGIVGKIPKALKRLPKTAQAVSRLASGGFGALMASQVPEIYEQYKKAKADGNEQEESRLLTVGLGTTLFSALGFGGAIKGRKPIVSQPERLALPAPEQVVERPPRVIESGTERIGERVTPITEGVEITPREPQFKPTLPVIDKTLPQSRISRTPTILPQVETLSQTYKQVLDTLEPNPAIVDMSVRLFEILPRERQIKEITRLKEQPETYETPKFPTQFEFREPQLPVVSKEPTVTPARLPAIAPVEAKPPESPIVRPEVAKPQIEPVSAEPKEAWEMTFDEFKEGGSPKLRARLHRESIEQAISEGKPVPPEVLKDYPELQTQAKPEANLPVVKQRLFAVLGNKKIEVSSFQDASKKQDEFFRVAQEEGLPFPLPSIRLQDQNGNVVAYVSQNGRVWKGKPEDWKSGTKPIYDPSLVKNAPILSETKEQAIAQNLEAVKPIVEKAKYKDYQDIHNAIENGELKIGDTATVKAYGGKSIKIVPAEGIGALGFRIKYRIEEVKKPIVSKKIEQNLEAVKPIVEKSISRDKLENLASEKIKASPSYKKLLEAASRFKKSLGYNLDSAKEQYELTPEDLLTAHAGVMDARSQRAKTLRALADAVFTETKLPRHPEGRFRGENGIDFEKLEKRLKKKLPPEAGATTLPVELAGKIIDLAKKSKDYAEFAAKVIGNPALVGDLRKYAPKDVTSTLKSYFDEAKSGVVLPVVSKEKKETVLPVVKKEFQKPESRVLEGVRKTADEVFGIVSTRLENISPEIKDRAVKHAFDEKMAISKDTKTIEPFKKTFNKLSDTEQFDLTKHLYNGDFDLAKNVFEKKGNSSDFEQIRPLLNGIFERAKESKVKVEYRQNYFPRKIRDFEGLMNEFGTEVKTAIEKAIEAQADKMGISPAEVPIETKGKIADSMLRGWSMNRIFLSDPRYAKAREIETLTDRMARHYAPANEALADYVNTMNRAIEANKFFKKGRTIKETLEPETVLSKGELEKSIGDVVAELKQKGELTDYKKEIELRGILKDYFQPAISGKGISGLKSITYALTLGNPVSAMTQLQSIGITLAKDGIGNTAKAVGKKVLGQSEWKLTDIGIDKAKADVERQISKRGVDIIMKPLEIADVYDKEVNLNANWERYRNGVRSGNKDISKTIDRLFGNEAKQVTEDIRNNKKTPDTAFLMFYELSKYHPISMLEVPQAYLRSGKGRLLYTLHTYQLKQLGIFRDTINENVKDGKYIKAGYDSAKLAFWLVSAGVGVKAARDFIFTGKTDELKDYISDSAWQVALVNRYVADKSYREGIAKTLWGASMPAIGSIVDDLQKDVRLGLKKYYSEESLAEKEITKKQKEKIEAEKFRFPKYLPIVGKPYYGLYGRGADFREREEKKQERKSVLPKVYAR